MDDIMTLLWTILFCLNAVGVLAGDVVGYCGGGVSIRCEYDTQYGQRPKYFCQGEQGDCRELIRTSAKGKWVSKDRFSLFDNGTHYFIVSISELTMSDSGRYQCGVSVLGGEPVQTEVNLKVKDDMSSCGMTMVKTAYVGETLNVTCPYLDVHEHAAKYLCKAFRGQSCKYRVSAQADSTWVHSDKVSVYDDRKGRVFTALLSNLGMYDRGSYWCGVETGWEHGGEDGYKALIHKLQLTVGATRPLYSGTTEANDFAWTTADTETPTTALSAEDTTVGLPEDTTPVAMVTTSEALHMTTEPVHTTEPDLTTGKTDQEIPMMTEHLPTTTMKTTTELLPPTIPEMTTEPPPPTITERTTEQPLPSTAMTTRKEQGQGSPVPENVLVSTSVPTILENSSQLWRMVVYGILALLGLVFLCAVVLFIIRRVKRDRAAAYSPSHMSMEALWDSPLLSNPLGYSLNPLDSTSFEPKSSGANTSELNSSEPKTSETNTSEPNSSEPKQSDI